MSDAYKSRHARRNKRESQKYANDAWYNIICTSYCNFSRSVTNDCILIIPLIIDSLNVKNSEHLSKGPRAWSDLNYTTNSRKLKDIQQYYKNENNLHIITS